MPIGHAYLVSIHDYDPWPLTLTTGSGHHEKKNGSDHEPDY